MPGIFVHSGVLFGTACDARDRAIAAVQADSRVWPSDTIVAIVLAAAATEAFINELAETVALDKDHSWREFTPISPSLRAFADALQEIEEARGSLLLKYLIASQTLSGSTFNKGINPYQDFATLVNLRNDLMHLKPRDTFIHSEGGSTLVQPPKYIKNLQQRGLARPSEKSVSMSWLNIIQTAEMAIWSCDTAYNIILAVLEFIPDDPIPGLDPSGIFKTMFRKKQNQVSA